MGIETIIFDLGNTVVNFDHRIAVRKILPFTDKSFKEILDLFFDSDITERFETGKINSRQFFNEVKKMLNLKLSSGNFEPIWNEIFSCNQEMERLVKKLSNNYRLVLLSNINQMHMDYIKKEFEIIKSFDIIVASHEVGHRKPAKQIYEHALKAAKCHKHSLVYTDDRLDLIKISSSLGINSIQFKNAGQLKKELKGFGIKTD